MKSNAKADMEAAIAESLPAWGAWVEILLVNVKLLQSCVAPWMGRRAWTR